MQVYSHTEQNHMYCGMLCAKERCYGLTVRKVEGVGTEYIRKVKHVLRTIIIAFISQYPRRQPSLYDYASRPSRESWELPHAT